MLGGWSQGEAFGHKVQSGGALHGRRARGEGAKKAARVESCSPLRPVSQPRVRAASTLTRDIVLTALKHTFKFPFWKRNALVGSCLIWYQRWGWVPGVTAGGRTLTRLVEALVPEFGPGQPEFAPGQMTVLSSSK